MFRVKLLFFLLPFISYAQVTAIPGGGGGSGTVTAGSGINVVGSTVSVDTTTILTRERGQTGADHVCSDSGVDDTYTCTPEFTPTAYTTGMEIRLIVTTANTGAATVDFGGLGVKNILTSSGATPANGDIATGRVNLLHYDGTAFRIVGGGTSITVAQPYMIVAGTYYMPHLAMFAATLPPTTGWSSDGSPVLVTSGLNGQISLTTSAPAIGLEAVRRSFGTTRTLVAAFSFNNRQLTTGTSRCTVGIKSASSSPAGRYAGFTLTSTSSKGLVLGWTKWTNARVHDYDADTYYALPQGTWALVRITVGTNIKYEFSTDGGTSWTTYVENTYASGGEFGFASGVTNSDEWIIGASSNASYNTTCIVASWSTT